MGSGRRNPNSPAKPSRPSQPQVLLPPWAARKWISGESACAETGVGCASTPARTSAEASISVRIDRLLSSEAMDESAPGDRTDVSLACLTHGRKRAGGAHFVDRKSDGDSCQPASNLRDSRGHLASTPMCAAARSRSKACISAPPRSSTTMRPRLYSQRAAGRRWSAFRSATASAARPRWTCLITRTWLHDYPCQIAAPKAVPRLCNWHLKG